jgi:hypothetical protein
MKLTLHSMGTRTVGTTNCAISQNLYIQLHRHPEKARSQNRNFALPLSLHKRHLSLCFARKLLIDGGADTLRLRGCEIPRYVVFN